MARSGDTYSLPTSNSWVYPSAGQPISSADWTTLVNDIKDALSQSLRRDGGGTMSGPLLLPDGTLALPGMSFSLDPDMGFYRSAANTMIASCGNANSIRMTAGNLEVYQSAAWRSVLTTYNRTFGQYTIAIATDFSGSYATLPTWTLVTAQTNSDFSVDTTTGIVTINTTGVYRISYKIVGVCDNMGGGNGLYGAIQLNGSGQLGQTVATTWFYDPTALAVGIGHVSATNLLSLSATNTLRVQAKVTTTSTGTETAGGCHFNIERLQ